METGGIENRRPPCRAGACPHKRLLNQALPALMLPFGFREALGNLRPVGQCVNQSWSREDGRTDLTYHVLRLTPWAPALDAIRTPRGKSFSPLRSSARPAGWSAASRGAKRGSFLDHAWVDAQGP